ncbi:hypothetical protein THRCLA_20888 [Thraustotheca clavata]|uniref:Uncharacterized protein n=1 Tax=Thraustotheca clavata TaxID=74557 RepID=A0A1W0A2B0_9STRA|nr:hypothetical protein THRCLA_20888 [Thraustotheca clavata]
MGASKEGIVLYHPDDVEYNPLYRPRSLSLNIGKIHSCDTQTTRASLHDARGASTMTIDTETDYDPDEFFDDCPLLQDSQTMSEWWKDQLTKLLLKFRRNKQKPTRRATA